MNNKNKFDLEERTASLAEDIIDLVKSVKVNPVNQRIIPQLVASSGSIAANYCEATEAESKKDFIHKIGISKKEKLKVMWKEAHELLLIFSKIKSSSSKRD